MIAPRHRVARVRFSIWCLGFALLVCVGAHAQEAKTTPPQPGPMLLEGTEDFETPEFHLTLVRSSQTVAALHPKTDSQFDFTPGDRLSQRSHDGFYHLGDIDIRLRTERGD